MLEEQDRSVIHESLQERYVTCSAKVCWTHIPFYWITSIAKSYKIGDIIRLCLRLNVTPLNLATVPVHLSVLLQALFVISFFKFLFRTRSISISLCLGFETFYQPEQSVAVGPSSYRNVSSFSCGLSSTANTGIAHGPLLKSHYPRRDRIAGANTALKTKAGPDELCTPGTVAVIFKNDCSVHDFFFRTGEARPCRTRPDPGPLCTEPYFRFLAQSSRWSRSLSDLSFAAQSAAALWNHLEVSLLFASP
ncbi:hypothetical protein PoB_007112100 [Plakobranchus ocellatus]|uniref:Uncharacterized protein n=1 Tax=Plakobranchus ocellatus TaxID=259542 RepID=A0AAV4DK99_9GAST|nr:hypothetical protein PoB_007112100 [Plakobranchus ocellatus]